MQTRTELINNLNLARQRLQKFSCPEFKNIYSYQYATNILLPLLKGHKNTYSCIFGDFNKLGIINEVYGHDFGDKALKTSLELIKRSLPQNAFTIRFGGDEIFIVLPNTDKEKSTEYIDKIHKNLADNSTLVGGLSIELASADSTMGDINELINITDSEVSTIKASRKQNDSPAEILSDDFMPLKVPDSNISDSELKNWDELNNRINVAIYNFIQNLRPSKTLNFDLNQITDSSSFIIAATSYLLNKKTR